MGNGIRDAVLFLSATSLTTMMRLGLGFRRGWVPGEAHRALRLVWGSGRGGSVNHAKAPAMVGTKRRKTPRQVARWPERSTPTAGRVSNGRGTNVKPRPPDWTEDEGLEHSVASARAACGEQSQIRSGSVPSWATLGRANHPSGRARATGTMPPGFYGGKPWIKPDNATIITGLKPGWYPLQGSTPGSFNRVHKNIN